MAKATKPKAKKQVETLTHEDASRKNIPTAEYEAVLHEKDKSSVRVAYERRNRDLDPQLVWRGKDEQDWSDLVVHAPPLYIQEKVHPKVLIDDLRRRTEQAQAEAEEQDQGFMGDLFADFNGLPSEDAKTEFYQHDSHWSNRMILGDSLQVMASLAEREGLRGKVQCIYFDPPYGIKFNSNFQWSTTSPDAKDGKIDQITREPEQVKAFRDTWRDGIHSYMTYLRDRLSVARDLLSDSGSIFIQIGDENVHRVRCLLDEVFGEDNFVSEIAFAKTTSSTSNDLSGVYDIILWYSKNKQSFKYRPIYLPKIAGGPGGTGYTRVQNNYGNVEAAKKYTDKDGNLVLNDGEYLVFPDSIRSQSPGSRYDVYYKGKKYRPEPNYWKTDESNFQRLLKANRIYGTKTNLSYVRRYNDFPVYPMSNFWNDTVGQNQFGGKKIYVVQTGLSVVQRCLLMASDPGDLVLDPTCGSGTTAYVAEHWGRRWITIDTSRVALALARSRIMGARYPYYLLADSGDGLQKEAEITRSAPSVKPTTNNIRYGFVYERVPHITLKAIANNTEIEVIWDRAQDELEPLRHLLNKELGKSWEEWEIPSEVDESWTKQAKELHASWWKQVIARQTEIDASIAAKADSEYLYDKPYEDNKKVRVAGPFTVESLSPHRALTVGMDDELIDPTEQKGEFEEEQDFVQIILENLKTAGVQQANKEDKISFISLSPWPGQLVCAEGKYIDDTEAEKRAAIFIGPEFGTVSRPDLVQAAREAADAGFDVLIACAFNYDAHSTEFEKLGRVPVLKARMNADLHMADDLKNTGKGNLFVIFGEPDIDILEAEDEQIQVKINGVDVFHPNTGEVRSDGAEGIACWFIDTDYNEESFFVRQAYFLGANDPYKSLKTTLKAEIDQEAWDTLNSDISRPFEKPKNGRIAVKVINHLGDEVMKVYRV
ncbi:site-specific DNA-methyltransferase [Neptuniibacter marinus]|uniref:site-specific DNA-methyltransferase n=1 Tax=Neptuniibacter marinus TaxID=1806670 RepID=UPI003B5BDE67